MWIRDSILSEAFEKPFLKEFTLRSEVPAARIQDALARFGVFGAVEVEPGLVNFCVTEKISKEDIDAVVTLLKSSFNRGE